MVDIKLLLVLGFPIFFWVLFSTVVAADPSVQELEALRFLSELEQLKSRISFLESNINERNHELQNKDQSIRQMEKIIQEKLDKVATLENEIALLQQQGSSDDKEHTSKEQTHIDEFEKQVDRLRKEIEVQNQKKDTLEARADEVEKKIHELNLKLESLQYTNHEQKIRTLRTEQALQSAEEEILTVSLKESSLAEDKTEVFGGWHSRWLAVRLRHLQSFWNESGRPVTNEAYQKLLDNKAQVEQWLEIHFQNIKKEWIPNFIEHWMMFTTYLEPHVCWLATTTVDVYYEFKNSLMPQVVQVIEEFTKPYINQASTVAKPHLEKAQIALKPYQKIVVNAYQKFINFAASYHYQVQEVLKNNELTRPFAVVDLAWFMASTSLALPIVFLFNLCLQICRPRKLFRASNVRQTRRRAKRSYQHL